MTLPLRVLSDHAYGPEPLNTCYWAETVPDWQLDCPPLQGETRAEVAVIGGGYTGLNAALNLAHAGVDVLLLESQFPGWGASGRNGGFCCLGGANLDNDALERAVGEQGRREWRQVERLAVAHVADLLTAEGIKADTHSDGETILAHSPRAMRGLESELASIRTDYGVDAQLHDRADLERLGMAGPYHGGLSIPIGFALNPRKYVLGLLRAAQGAGARIHGFSPVQRIGREKALFRLETAQGQVLAHKVIFATNGYGSEDLPPWMAGRFMPVQSSVLVTRPLSPDEIGQSGWTSSQMAYNTRNLLYYFRLMPCGRMMFGRRGGVLSSPQSDARTMADTRQHFERHFPSLAHVETPYGWHGFLSVNRSEIPFVGPVPDMPGAFAGFSYHGNGVAMGSYAGAILADLARDNTPTRTYPAVMQQSPRRYPLGRHRRMLLPLGYLAMSIKDNLG